MRPVRVQVSCPAAGPPTLHAALAQSVHQAQYQHVKPRGCSHIKGRNAHRVEPFSTENLSSQSSTMMRICRWECHHPAFSPGSAQRHHLSLSHPRRPLLFWQVRSSSLPKVTVKRLSRHSDPSTAQQSMPQQSTPQQSTTRHSGCVDLFEDNTSFD
jgi:hypothetical protein